MASTNLATILRQVALVAAFVGGWALLLSGLSLTGLEVHHAGGALTRLVKGKPRHAPSAPDPTASVAPDPTAPVVVVTTKPAAPQSAAALAPAVAKQADPPLIPDDLRLLLPPRLFAAVDAELSIYFENLVLTRYPDQLRFDVKSDVGRSARRRWSVTPSAKDVGEHPIHVTIRDWRGKKVLAEGKTSLVVVPADAGSGKSLRLLIVGDSLTHSTFHINELTRRLSMPGNPAWELLGTNSAQQALPGVRHEGYGGWTWNCFCTYDVPGSAKKRYRERSPFLYPSQGGSTALDVGRYFREHCGAVPPDVVLFELGVNDVFCLQPDQKAVLDAYLPQVMASADKLLAAFRKAAPKAALVILLPAPLTASERIYQDIYAPEFNRWRIQRNVHRLLEDFSRHFAEREKDGVYLLPAYHNFDVYDGYPVDDPAHPNEFGCKQYATSIHNWLLWWYATRGQPQQTATLPKRQ